MKNTNVVSFRCYGPPEPPPEPVLEDDDDLMAKLLLSILVARQRVARHTEDLKQRGILAMGGNVSDYMHTRWDKVKDEFNVVGNAEEVECKWCTTPTTGKKRRFPLLAEAIMSHARGRAHRDERKRHRV